jgi:hypothetical protein
MNFASKLAYITKKKVEAGVLKEDEIAEKSEEAEEVEGAERQLTGRLPLVEHARKKSRSRSRSLSSISDEDLDNFCKSNSGSMSLSGSEDEPILVMKKAEAASISPILSGPRGSSLKRPTSIRFQHLLACAAEAPPPGNPVALSPKAKSKKKSASGIEEEKADEKRKRKRKQAHKEEKAPVPLSLAAGSAGKKYKQEVDTNVLSLDLTILKNKTEIATGDAIVCSKCKAIFNIHSKLNTDPASNEQTWICEFCSTLNKVSIEEEEIPKTEELTYIIASAQQAMLKKGGGENITVIFCIDVSGSMCVTQPVTGKMKLKYDKVNKLQDLMKFSDGSYQYTDRESRNTTYVSRMQCVQAAIENQLNELANGAPNRRAGIVIFNSEVVLIGDGSTPPKTYAGDKLSNYEELLQAAQVDAGIHMTKPISATKEELIHGLETIEESGQTALGPALVVSLGLAMKGAPGSRVIICTDGLANVGLGSLENLVTEESITATKGFYTKLGELAKERGISISIVSIVGEDCRLEMLSPLAELTGGDIIKVDPLNLSKDFANILSDAIIATNVELKVKIHKGFTFRNENPENISQDGSLMVRQIGNASEGQEVTIEYCTKSSKELKEMKDIDFSKIPALPFQAQINYVTLEGMRCVRLITKQQKVTFDKEEAKKELNYKLISVNAMQKTAQLAKKGNYRAAQANAHHWERMMRGAPEHSDYVTNAAPLYGAVQDQQWEDFYEDNVGVMEGSEKGKKLGKKKQNDKLVSYSHQGGRLNFNKMKKK